MGKSSTSTYICQNRHGTYYARLIIPKTFQNQFNNKREIRRSLQTDSRKLAIKKARGYRVKFETLIDGLMAEYEDTLKRSEKSVIDVLKGEFGAFQLKIVGETTATLHNGEEKLITGKIERNLTKDEFEVLRDSENKADINRDDRKYLAQQLREEAKREQETADMLQKEKRAEELHRAQLAAITVAVPTPLPVQPTGKTINAYLKDYEKYQTTPDTKDGWKSESTVRNKKGMLNAFLSQYGSKPAVAFTWQDAKQYTKLARSIPPYFTNPSHKAKFVGLTMEMLLDEGIDTSEYKTRKPSAIWNDLKTVRAFLEWIRTEDRIKGLQDAIEEFDKEIGRTTHKSENRRGFNVEELKVLFEQNNPASENYVKGFNSNRGIDANLKYWLPLLALYSGATLAELCQLHLSDIYRHKAFDGSEHWVIDINDQDDKRTKNEHRPRLIPIHKNLLNLGLPNYIQKLKAADELKLFPAAKRVGGEFGAESQWWGEYSSNAGITDKGLVFHSFRTTILDYLRDNHVDRDKISAIAGHGIPTTANKFYRSGDYRNSDIGPLAEAINSIDYGLINPDRIDAG